jgi:hypothetical protein
MEFDAPNHVKADRIAATMAVVPQTITIDLRWNASAACAIFLMSDCCIVTWHPQSKAQSGASGIAKKYAPTGQTSLTAAAISLTFGDTHR